MISESRIREAWRLCNAVMTALRQEDAKAHLLDMGWTEDSLAELRGSLGEIAHEVSLLNHIPPRTERQ